MTLEQQRTQFPEINLNNYTDVEVERLNSWGIAICTEVEKVLQQVAVVTKERDDDRQAAKWESDLAGKAIDDLKTMTAERDALKEKLRAFDGLTELAKQFKQLSTGCWVNGQAHVIDEAKHRGIETRTVYTFTDSRTHKPWPMSDAEIVQLWVDTNGVDLHQVARTIKAYEKYLGIGVSE